jgi:4-amino-4-deoxy-L-arabinose transferase-like glycosyltransferase
MSAMVPSAADAPCWRDPDFRIVALAACVAYFARLWEGSFDGDVAVYASVAKGMAQSGDWFDTRTGSHPYLNKPPLLFWLTGALFALFGTSTFTAAFWSAAFGVATCLALHRLARELFDAPTALLASFVLVLTPEMIRYGTTFRLESACSFFLVMTLLDVLRAAKRADARPLERAGVWIGLAFLAKGGPGFIALACAGGFLLWQRRASLLWQRPALRGLLWLLALALFWPLVQTARHGSGYLGILLGRELFTRSEYGAQNPVLFYAWRLLRNYWIWLPALALGARRLWQERAARGEAFRLLAVWIPVGLVLISLPERKHARYLTSVYPAFALLAGFCLAALLDPARLARLRQLAPRLALAAAVVLLCLPVPLHLDDARPTRELGAVLAALTPPHAPVAAYGRVQLFWRGQMHFYLDRDVEQLPSLSALEASGAPLVLCFLEPCRDLERAGWRPHIESWRWTAYLRPGLARPDVPAGSAAAAAQTELVSRRLE